MDEAVQYTESTFKKKGPAGPQEEVGTFPVVSVFPPVTAFPRRQPSFRLSIFESIREARSEIHLLPQREKFCDQRVTR